VCTPKPCSPDYPTNKVFRNDVINNLRTFTETAVTTFAGKRNGPGSLTFADIDRDGRIDVLYPEYVYNLSGQAASWFSYLRNTTTLAAGAGSFTVDVRGSNGERNQYGRLIEVTRPSLVKMVRVVDGGSGELSQGQYELLVGTPESGAHTVKVRYAPAAPAQQPQIVQFTIKPGQHATVFAPKPGVAGRVTMNGGWIAPVLRR
jgi:hypothetical protein